MHLHRVILKTSSIEKTKAFYTQALGLDVVTETNASISFSVGSSTLCFELEERTDAFYHFAFNVAENKLEEAMQYIEQKGVPILDFKGERFADFTDWNAKSFYFHDNNNNIVELIARYDLGYTTDQPFDKNALTEISEIGFVVENVRQAASTLQRDYNMQLFSKGPDKDDFMVLGDDNGLILLSATNRGWYPTDIPAIPYPVSLHCDHGTVDQSQLS